MYNNIINLGDLKSPLIFPSLISADILNVVNTIKNLEEYCDGFHIDIMDFHFVDDLTFGPSFVNAVRSITNKRLWIHLMVDYPEKYIERFLLYPLDIISIHLESKREQSLQDISSIIKSKCLIYSLAINPETKFSSDLFFEYFFDDLLIMSVNPGFSGQKFIESTIDKVSSASSFREANNLNFSISIDGGIDEYKIIELKKYCINNLVAGSSIFNNKKYENYLDAINALYNAFK